MIPNMKQAVAMVQHVMKTRGPEAARGFVERYAHEYPAPAVQQMLASIPQQRNYGGLVAYRQVGGPVPSADEVGSEMGIPMAPPAQPAAPAQMPAAPVAPVRKSFAEKVEEARAQIKKRDVVVPVGNPVAEAMMNTDGQGNPVDLIDPTGVFEADMSAQGVGPDMPFDDGMGGVGYDDIDGTLPEGTMVMNSEATELFRDELDQMMNEGGYLR